MHKEKREVKRGILRLIFFSLTCGQTMYNIQCTNDVQLYKTNFSYDVLQMKFCQLF